MQRSKAGQAGVAAITATIAERLGIAETAVEGFFGNPIYRAEGASPVTKALHASIADVWMARAEAGDDYLAIHKQGPFKPLHDLDHALRELLLRGLGVKSDERQTGRREQDKYR